MALNVALPLAGYGDLLEGFGLLSPISPINTNCREIYKKLISPQGSESSGVSSLDSEEIKKLTSPKTTSPPAVDSNNNNNEKETELSLLMNDDQSHVAANAVTSVTPSPEPQQQQAIVEAIKEQPQPQPIQPQKPLKVFVNGRNILDLGANLRDDSFNLRYTVLPEKNNLKIFFANRSQYHRLGANGHVQEYTLVKCNCCDFRYPVNGCVTPNNNYNLSTANNMNNVGSMPNAKNMTNNVANTAAANINNNMMQFGNNNNTNNNAYQFNQQPQQQQQQQQQLNNNNTFPNYQNTKQSPSSYYNNSNNIMMNNNNNNTSNNSSVNAKMLMNQQFNKNMAPTYGLYKQF